MQVRAQCSNPDCGKAYTLSAELVGKNVRCKQCLQTFTVSSSQETFGGAPSAQSDTAEVVTKDAASQRLARFEIHERLGAARTELYTARGETRAGAHQDRRARTPCRTVASARPPI